MNKTSLLLLALAAGAPLLAQAPGLTLSSGDSNITLYGILDAGVANVSHTLDFDSYHPVSTNPTLTKKGNDSATGMFNGGISQTRVGLKGGLDIGDGWKAIFTLESAINLNNGNISNAAEGIALNRSTGPQFTADSAVSGQLFARGAYIGLSSETYGTLTIGRHPSLMLEAIPAYDALQGAQLFTPIGYSGVYGGGGATDSSRVDNSVKYRVKIGDVSLGGLYKFGGVAGASSAKSATEFTAAYEAAGFGIMVGYQNLKDATAVGNPAGSITAAATPIQANGTALYQPLGTVTLTCEDTKAIMAAARYKITDWLFTAGYQKLEYTNPSNPANDALITNIYGYAVGTVVVNGAVGQAVNVTPFTVGGSAMEKDLTVFWVGAKYDITKKFNVGVSYYHVGQNDFSNGTATAADKSGSTKYISALVDYAYNRAFDAYLGFMSVKGSDGMVAGYTYDSNKVVGVGLRYKF